MKNLILPLVCIFLLFSCKDGKSNTTSKNNTTKIEVKKPSAKIEDFECATFLKKGDYSSLCFTGSKLLDYNSRDCIFDFVLKGNKHEQDLQIQFVGKNSAMLAEMHFNLDKSNYKKGKVTAVSNLGDSAFFDVYGTDLKSLSRSNKDLCVRYNNIVFKIMAEYKSNTKMPCFYNDKDLIVFAEAIINNF